MGHANVSSMLWFKSVSIKFKYLLNNVFDLPGNYNLTVSFIHVIQEGYSGFSSCQGCRRCECGPASVRSTCHPLTHSCPCRPGAGGRYCERCLPGYWDYSPSGCQSKSLDCTHAKLFCWSHEMKTVCQNIQGENPSGGKTLHSALVFSRPLLQ